jgi:phosphatidylglycerophosphate synthase
MPTGHAQQRLTTPQTCADPRNLSCDARIGGERDRRVARRTGTATALGARLDGEVDAFLILALSVYVAPAAGAWVLAIGAARYLFLAGEWLLPWMRAPLPPRRWRRIVAAAQGIVLTIAAAEVLPRALRGCPVARRTS